MNHKLYKDETLLKHMNNEENKQNPKEENLSPVEQATKLLSEINSAKEELKKEKAEIEELKANNLLSGTAGGHIEAPQVSEEDIKHKQAKEFWGEGLVGDALKAQEKKNG